MKHSFAGANNPMYGKHHSEETKRKISLNKGNTGRKFPPEHRERMRLAKLGQRNPMWKGDNVCNDALHHWIHRHFPKPELCQICNDKTPYDIANINSKYNPETYTRDLKNWRWLCRRCHMESDGRMENLRQDGIRRL